MSKSNKSKAAVAVRKGGEFEAMTGAPAPAKKKAKKEKAAPTTEQEAPTAAPAKQVANETGPTPEATEAPTIPISTQDDSPTTQESGAHDDFDGRAAALPALTTTDLKAGYLAHIEVAGHTPLTRDSYGRDLDIAVAYFAPTRQVATITEAEVAAFNVCDLVLNKPKGGAKAMPTILKTRRVLRLALVWAAGAGLIAAAPIPSAKGELAKDVA